MADKPTKSIHKCTRCKEYHQRLIAIDNEYGPDEKICLSCLGELLIGRGQHGDRLIGKSDIKRMIGEMA